MVTENLCPVCGFQMEDPPCAYNICPSCGTEFGNNDLNASVDELRSAWLAAGPRWWSPVDPQPEHWDPINQLITGVYLNANLMAPEPERAVHPYKSVGRRSSLPRATRRRIRASRGKYFVPSRPPSVYQMMEGVT